MIRDIKPKMVDYLSNKLRYNGYAQEAIKSKKPRVVCRLALESCVGIREVGGNNQGPMVELIQETLGGADKEPWCMSLIQTGIAYAEEMTGIASPVYVSEHCLTVWHKTNAIHRVKLIPAIGAICIWRHGTSDSGHTACTIGEVVSKMVDMVEGNTESGIAEGEVVRDGGGVYFTNRSIKASGNMKVVGFIKPF